VRLRGKIVYDDGREVPVECGSAAIAQWEKYAHRNGYKTGVDAPGVLSSLVTAHAALGIEEDVDAWMLTVDDVELNALGPDGKVLQPGETAGVPPTPPAPSDA
jgi:hypothetical protein